MLAVLTTFKPYADLLRTREGIPLKSGSLSGVHCYAGYFTRGHGLDPFVILLNQQENSRDRILAMLRALHAARWEDQASAQAPPTNPRSPQRTRR